MNNKIILKKSSVAGKMPASSDLDYGELALNYADGVIYYKASNNQISPIAGAGNGAVYRNVDGGKAGNAASPNLIDGGGA